MSSRRRLDLLLVERGLATSRTAAQQLLADGRVLVDGVPVNKPASLVGAHAAVTLISADATWASRGALKLLGALDDLGVVVAGRSCLDTGASTGGFTDVLLARGATRVVAVDVGYGQLLWRLRSDPRVVVLDRTNARHLTPAVVPPPQPDLITADLSFISLTLVLPALAGVLAPGGELLVMVKPQFEVGPEQVGKGGVVRDPALWRVAVERVAAAAAALDLDVRGEAPSPLPGPAGNREFFLHLGDRRDPA